MPPINQHVRVALTPWQQFHTTYAHFTIIDITIIGNNHSNMAFLHELLEKLHKAAHSAKEC